MVVCGQITCLPRVRGGVGDCGDSSRVFFEVFNYTMTPLSSGSWQGIEGCEHL